MNAASTAAGSKYRFKAQECRVCGCTNLHACVGGCWWIAPDLCSRCAPPVANQGTPSKSPKQEIAA